MSDSRDCIGPELQPSLPEGFLEETPEQHTAKVLAEVDRLLGNGSLLYVSVELDAEGKRYADSDAYTTQGHETFIGALSALIEAIRADDETHETCQGSHCNHLGTPRPLHSCPYAEEINDDHDKQCNCCELCEAECRDDI